MGNKHVRKHLSGIIATITLAFVAVISLTGSGQAFAVTSKTTTNQANTLKISPVRTDLTVKPGETGTVTMKVTNLTKTPMTLQAIENDFVAGDEKGTPALILDANTYAPTHSLKRFMSPLSNVTIPASKTQDVVLTIKVPIDGKPGGYYGAVRFVPLVADGSSSVNLSASAASLILMTVPGDLVEQLNLTNFDIKQDGHAVGGFLNSPDNMSVDVRFTNSGNVQAAPYGQVYVKQGNKVLYTKDFNQDEPRDMVLPDSARKWTVPLDKLGAFGQYTIGATFTYGTSNKSVDISKTIWIVPITYIIAAIVGIVVLILLIVGIWLFLRSYKRRVLNKHGGGGYRR